LDEEARKFANSMDVRAFEIFFSKSTDFVRKISSSQFKEFYEIVKSNSFEIARDGVDIIRKPMDNIRHDIVRTNNFVEELRGYLNKVLSSGLNEQGFRLLSYATDRAKEITRELGLTPESLKRNDLKMLRQLHEKIESIKNALTSLKGGDNPISDDAFERIVEDLGRQVGELEKSIEKIIKTYTVIWRVFRKYSAKLYEDYLKAIKAKDSEEERQKLIEGIRKTVKSLEELKARYGIVGNI